MVWIIDSPYEDHWQNAQKAAKYIKIKPSYRHILKYVYYQK